MKSIIVQIDAAAGAVDLLHSLTTSGVLLESLAEECDVVSAKSRIDDDLANVPHVLPESALLRMIAGRRPAQIISLY